MKVAEWGHRLREAWTGARLHRRVWVGEQRAYVEVRTAEVQGFAVALREALEGSPEVEWARLNAALGRMVVSFVGQPIAAARLLEIVAAVEAELGRRGVVGWEGRRPFPGDPEPLLRST